MSLVQRYPMTVLAFLLAMVFLITRQFKSVDNSSVATLPESHRYVHGMPLKSISVDERGCPHYHPYSTVRHSPHSLGSLQLPYQRPSKECRTFHCDEVDQLIETMKDQILDKDIARLFENNFPSTLDTTIRWTNTRSKSPRTFVITGDINAEWIRDSTNQLLPYLSLLKQSELLQQLFKGALLTQAEYILEAPYCNAFQPPPASGIAPVKQKKDRVFPDYDSNIVFECKYELDSLAAFLKLGNAYWDTTGDNSFAHMESDLWLLAANKVLNVIDEQSLPIFNITSFEFSPPKYIFRRWTDTGTETLPVGGTGNPINANTKLVRSAFRPSDDSTIFQFLVPANAYLSVELGKFSDLVAAMGTSDYLKQLAARAREKSDDIRRGVNDYAIFPHPVFGDVFAYEIDGFGSRLFMDDANLPSLLSLPLLGFVDRDDPIYQNTRRMILSSQGNPYYLQGSQFSAIGGPHVGLEHAWPMSSIVRVMTSNNETEIKAELEQLKYSTAGLGLMHESVNVNRVKTYTRPWFAWCSSLFGEMIIDIYNRYPHVLI